MHYQILKIFINYKCSSVFGCICCIYADLNKLYYNILLLFYAID